MAFKTKALLNWYQKNYRKFPWRETKDPYKIWISEIMLQQTRANAVIPYYKNFLNKFPDLNRLAKSKEEKVLEAWAGLGYYSRAKNLHKAAKQISQLKSFPKTYQELLKIPGFGPYTARSVASFAFDDICAVLDGNVIRFLSRYHQLNLEWWRPKERQKMQSIADQWLNKYQSSQVNQALIEIGASICLPTNPACLICPVNKSCKALQKDQVHKLPLKKKKRKHENWLVEMCWLNQKGKIALQKNTTAPFLKQEWLLPLKAKKIIGKPKQFDYQHAITHHKIYVRVLPPSVRTRNLIKKDLNWVAKREIKRMSPFSFTQKAIEYAKKMDF